MNVKVPVSNVEVHIFQLRYLQRLRCYTHFGYEEKNIRQGVQYSVWLSGEQNNSHCLSCQAQLR